MDSSDIQNAEFLMRKLWPDSVAEQNFGGFEPDDSAIIDEVMSMGIVCASK